jgi:hypothetical protein
MLNDITDQLEIIRQNVNNIKIEEAESKMNLNNFEDSNEYIATKELTTSFVCDDNFENSKCGNNNINNNYDYSKKHKKDYEKKDLNKAILTTGSDGNFIIPATQEGRRLQQLGQARKENIEYKKRIREIKDSATRTKS